MTHKWSVTPTEKRNVTISCNLFLLNRYNSRNEWGRWGEKKHGVFSFRDGYFCCVPLKFWGAVTNTRTHRSSSFSLFFLLGPHLSLHPWAALFFRSSSSLFFFTYIFFCVCVWGSCDNWRRGRRVIERGGSRSAVCVRVQQRRSEWGRGWGRGRQRHLWSGPTNLIFHVSPSRSLSPRRLLSHKNVYFVSPYFCF